MALSMDQYTAAEIDALNKAKQYRADLPMVFDKLNNDIKAQIDSLHHRLNNLIHEIEQKIVGNL